MHASNPNNFCGGFGEREIPVPIPNTAVKPLSADDTARATLWESKSPPLSFETARLSLRWAVLFYLLPQILSKMKSWKLALLVTLGHYLSRFFVDMLIFVDTRTFNSPPLPLTSYDRLLQGVASALNFPFDAHVWPIYLSSVFWGVVLYILSTLIQKKRKTYLAAPSPAVPPLAQPGESKKAPQR